MYSVEQFIELSPSEAHSEDVLSNEHQLMLNRLGFELVERQRFSDFSPATVRLTHAHFARLDRKVKELAQEKEELLKTSKSQATTTESVKTQIETLLKVALTFVSCPENLLSVIVLPDRI
jgi:THO complex subunit 5